MALGRDAQSAGADSGEPENLFGGVSRRRDAGDPHAAFTMSESLESFLPVFKQGILKRGLPQRLFVDQGAPIAQSRS